MNHLAVRLGAAFAFGLLAVLVVNRWVGRGVTRAIECLR